MLFANGAVITEGDSEYLSVPILLKKLGYSLEDYNIEIINARSENNIKSCIDVVKELCIPFRVVCDNKAISKVPEDYKNKVFKCPDDDWCNYLVKLFPNSLKDVKDVEEKMKNFKKPIEEFIEEIIEECCKNRAKINTVWEIINNVPEKDVKEKMKDFKKFIDEFIEIYRKVL